jgi:uncharacterized protein (TIGR02996 family)
MSPSREEAAFLAAIAENPDDPAYRLVFADWLEERGDPRGEWLRDPKLAPWMGLECEHPLRRLMESISFPNLALNHRQALAAIGELGPRGEEAVPRLVELLPRSDFPTLLSKTLGKIGRSAVKPLIEMLSSDDPFAPPIAALTLGRIGHAAIEALPILIEGASGKHGSSRIAFRERSIEAIGMIGPAAASAIPVLIDATTDRELYIRWLAADALGLVGYHEDSLQALIKLLTDPARGVQSAAIRAIGRFGSRSLPALPVLTSLCRRADPYVQEAVCEALGSIGPEASVLIPELLNFLESTNNYLRLKAALALAKLGYEDQIVEETLQVLASHRDISVAKIAQTELDRLRADADDESTPA